MRYYNTTRDAQMLLLSEVLLKEGHNVNSFEELVTTVQRLAVDNNEIHFEVDIEPPGYSDRPHLWHDQLNSAFESAR